VRAFLNGVGIKLLSLALAVVLWLVIAGEKSSEMGLTVPIELQNFPKDLELTGETVTVIELRLRASPGVIHGLGPSQVSARLDLEGVREGERIFHLSAENVRVPFGVRVVKITPSILTLNFERTLQKAVPVKPRLVGQPAAGFELYEVTSQPAEIRIAGPQSAVLALSGAHTEPVSVEGARSDVAENVNIGLGDPVLRIQGVSEVKAVARIREIPENRVFEGLALQVRGRVASVRPSAVTVELSGPASAVRRLRASDIWVRVEADPTQQGRRLPVIAGVVPGLAGVAVTRVVPSEVTVRYSPRKPGE
jgi:YbbR domain-containing protein